MGATISHNQLPHQTPRPNTTPITTPNAPLLQQQLYPLLYPNFVASISEPSTLMAPSTQQGMSLPEYGDLESRFGLQELQSSMDTDRHEAAELYLPQTHTASYLYTDDPLGLREPSR